MNSFKKLGNLRQGYSPGPLDIAAGKQSILDCVYWIRK